MAKTFRPFDRDQMLLMPPSLHDWVSEDHLARFVADVVETLDLSAIEDTYTEERGYPPYHPRMMVGVLLYAYCTGTYSSRKIAAKLADSVACRFLAAGNQPDFRTLSEFRRRHGEALAALFTQGLRLCRKAGLVKLGRVAIGGTKIKANASKHKAMSALEAEARTEAAARGRDPDDAEPPDKAQRNFTDPESKIQKTADGFIQGYNAQLAVDGGPAQIIVAQHVTPAAPDVQQLGPAVSAITKAVRDTPAAVLADAGYWSEANVEALEAKGIEPFIATQRQKHGAPPLRAPRGRPPVALGVRERMARTLATRRGRTIYALRKTIVEPVFGQIKHARGFRQFLRRGLVAVQQEWALICLSHNLLKLHAATSRG